jgi:hypothetical protein
MPRPTRFDIEDPELDRLADHADFLRDEAKDRAMEKAMERSEMRRNPVVSIRIREGLNDLTLDIPIDRRLWDEANRPLPRGREVILGDRLDGISQEKARHRLASSIAQHVAGTLAKHFAKDDTINGYSRQEWEEMHRHEKSGESEDSRES